MEEYTNKYMQVFDTYDQFAQNSADYVKGEDHIAYLIQENEVIYWLYLEQVWRLLNVRTTTTGQLEDGRSKVAVKLEYVEGGQKYTSVPNIPDPERITSMSHFLEDYPDIEEVNVTGTVNLTNLSHAFAGSKIRDFSKLDTSNVKYAYNLLQNVNDESLIVNFSSANSCYANYIVDGATLNEFNWIEGYGDTSAMLDEHVIKGIAYKACKINKFNIPYLFDNYDNTFKDYLSITVHTNNIITELIAPYIKIVVYNENLIPKDVKLSSIKGQYVLFNLGNSNNKNVVLKGNDLYIEAEDIEFNYSNNITNENGKIVLRNYCTPKHSVIVNNNYAPPRFNFGGGIKIKNDKEIVLGDNLIKNKTSIGNFIFTTPIVDDSFYAKYNHPISIFQYKTTFKEVADVKITEATDSSLIYVNWSSIDFDTSEMSVEFYNIDNDDLLYINTTLLHFKKFIADNTNISFDVNNKYDNRLTAILNITADEGYISGNYNTYNGFNLIINDLYKNINIYNTYRVILDKNITDDRNIKIYAGDVYGGRVNEEQVIITDIDFDEEIININSFVHDNKLLFGIESQWSNLNKPTLAPIANYIDGLEIYIDDTGDSLNAFYNYFLNSKENNPIHIGTRRTYKGIDTFNFHYVNINKYKDNIENIYLDMGDYVYLAPSLYNDNGILKNIFNIINIKGVVNIVIGLYNSTAMNTPITNNETSLRHIDINKTFCDNSSNHILYYKYCDDETNTNLITKLIDNTGSSIKTIYMYRSQANIIGDDNIAAAVAKNYEFAIIEN